MVVYTYRKNNLCLDPTQGKGHIMFYYICTLIAWPNDNTEMPKCQNSFLVVSKYYQEESCFPKYLEEVIIISYKSQKWIGRKYYSIRKMMRPFDKCLINIFNLFFIGSHGIDVG